MKFFINEKEYVVEVDPMMRLLDLLRDKLYLTGTKEGCGEGECGACTVIMDNKAVNACLVLAGQAQEREIITIEGVLEDKELSRIQQAFVECGAVQCGFCTPGMILDVYKRQEMPILWAHMMWIMFLRTFTVFLPTRCIRVLLGAIARRSFYLPKSN